ncbi:MAG: hypothetical protein ACK4RF_12310 [Cyclobacteriaceae bacterium]
MRYILTLTLLLQLTITSCEKEDSVSLEIRGKWDWKSTCGGFTGQCGYSSQDNIKTVEITESRLVEKVNGLTTLDTEYIIINKSMDGSSTSYEIELNNGQIWSFTLRTIETLNIVKGDFWDNYERATK